MFTKTMTYQMLTRGLMGVKDCTCGLHLYVVDDEQD